jgi:hypothetical protein
MEVRYQLRHSPATLASRLGNSGILANAPQGCLIGRERRSAVDDPVSDGSTRWL